MRERYIKKLLAEGWKKVPTKGDVLPCFEKDGIYVFVGANRIIKLDKTKGKK